MVASGVGRAQHPQVPAARDFHRVGGARSPAAAVRAPVLRACRFADRVGQCFQVVAAGVRRCGAVGEPHHFPAPWRGKPLTVFGAEVVTVGLGIGGERAEDRSRIGIDVRQCRDGRAAARGARTATYRAHDVGRYRTLERAATTPPSGHPTVSPCDLRHSGVPGGYPDLRQGGARLPRACRAGRGRGAARGVERRVNDQITGLKRAQPWPKCSTVDIRKWGGTLPWGRPAPFRESPSAALPKSPPAALLRSRSPAPLFPIAGRPPSPQEPVGRPLPRDRRPPSPRTRRPRRLHDRPGPGALRCVGDGQLRTSPPVRAAAPAP